MIGILGGTFDPVHFGHLRTALELYQDLGLTQMRLIPCREPPHRGRPRATAAQRLAMLTGAVAGQPGLMVDDRELRRDGPSYSVLTLRSLREEFAEVPLCMVVGKDAFAELDKWWRWRELLELAHIVVVDRPTARIAVSAEVAGVWAERSAAPEALAARPAGLIHTRHVTPLEISATRIRSMIAEGGSPRYLLPDAVLRIIEEQSLYRSPTDGDA